MLIFLGKQNTMQDFGDILDNSVLLVAVVACLIAQASKLVIELIKIAK